MKNFLLSFKTAKIFPKSLGEFFIAVRHTPIRCDLPVKPSTGSFNPQVAERLMQQTVNLCQVGSTPTLRT